MAKINNKCNSNSFYKNLIYIDILCNNCIFLVFCFYILYISAYVGYPGILYGYTCGYYMSVFRALFRPGYGDILETF